MRVSRRALRCAPLSVVARRTLAARPERDYFYDLNRRGELFLQDTKHRNYASTLTRDKRFSRFFWTHLRAAKDDEKGACPESRYQHFVSPCAGERNWVAIEEGGTPVVLVSLNDDTLSWAGGEPITFQPDRIRASFSGYLYHPSPANRKGELQYGRYSLLHSTLVVEHFSDITVDEGKGGSFSWQGERYEMAQLEPADALLGKS